MLIYLYISCTCSLLTSSPARSPPPPRSAWASRAGSWGDYQLIRRSPTMATVGPRLAAHKAFSRAPQRAWRTLRRSFWSALIMGSMEMNYPRQRRGWRGWGREWGRGVFYSSSSSLLRLSWLFWVSCFVLLSVLCFGLYYVFYFVLFLSSVSYFFCPVSSYFLSSVWSISFLFSLASFVFFLSPFLFFLFPLLRHHLHLPLCFFLLFLSFSFPFISYSYMASFRSTFVQLFFLHFIGLHYLFLCLCLILFFVSTSSSNYLYRVSFSFSSFLLPPLPLIFFVLLLILIFSSPIPLSYYLEARYRFLFCLFVCLFFTEMK